MRPSASPSETKRMPPHKSYILFCCSAAFVHTKWLNLSGVICLGTDLSHLSTTMDLLTTYFWICFFPVSDPRLSLTRSVCKHTGIQAFTSTINTLFKGKAALSNWDGFPPQVIWKSLFGSAENTSLFFCVYHLRTSNSVQNEIHTRTKAHSRLHASQWHTTIQNSS